MTILAFAPMHNSPGKRDATGAFQPEARAFLRYHRQDPRNLVVVDNTRSRQDMRALVLWALGNHHGPVLQGVAFFCHGYKAGIQFGLRADDIGAVLGAPRPRLVVTFYACDAGRDSDTLRSDDLEAFGGDGGYADLVRDHLCRAGARACVVDAHTTAAHTTRNPDVRRFEGLGPSGGAGGSYIVPRGHRLWSKWRAALRGPLRFDFPYMTTGDIHTYLEAVAS